MLIESLEAPHPAIELQMFLNRHEVEQGISLRTVPHVLGYLSLLSLNVHVENPHLATAHVDLAGQYLKAC